METSQQHEYNVHNTQNSTGRGVGKGLSFSHNRASGKASKPDSTMKIASTTSKTRPKKKVNVKHGSELAGAAREREGMEGVEYLRRSWPTVPSPASEGGLVECVLGGGEDGEKGEGISNKFIKDDGVLGYAIKIIRVNFLFFKNSGYLSIFSLIICI